MKENKGITLIALIITIVIMLILVAVSVNVLINSNIIGQAEKAAKGYKTAYEQEQTRIDELMEKWNRLEQDQESGCVHNWGEWQTVTPATCTNAGSQKRTCSLCNTSETQNIPVLEHNYSEATCTEPQTCTRCGATMGTALGHNYSDATCTEPQTCTRCGATTGTALGHNLVNGVCTRCGVNFEMTASDVANKPSIYGSTVTNYNANGIKWKVFYATTDRIYLIASDYVHYSKLTNAYKNGASCYNTGTHPYSYYWASGGTSLETTGRQDGIFMATGYTLNSSESNSKCVSGLLNTNNWTAFVDTNYADYAIGGPTLNMYKASWNAKGYTTLYTNTNTNGYYVGTSANPTTHDASISSDTAGYGDTLYYPHKSAYSNCNGYWLAAPSAYDAYNFMIVYFPGSVTYRNRFSSAFYGVRPLVSLKSGVTLQDNSNGTVTLKK